MNENVLVIDNQEESQNIIRKYMKGISCNVYSATDKVKGLQMFQQKNFSLIVCNTAHLLNDGIEVIKQIKKKRPEISIVAISDIQSPVELPLAEKSGADRLLCEPFSRMELIDTFNSIGYFIST